jgi:hypothetical protein
MFQVTFSGRWLSLPGLLALAALTLSGCGAPDRSTPPSAAAPTPLPAAVAAQPLGDRLYIRDGFTGDAERLTIVDSASGARERDLPPGVMSPDWSTLYVAEQSAGKTSVRALDVETSRALREIVLDGAYSLPLITPDSVMGGLSPDGRWLALTARAGSKKTQFVVLDTDFKQKPRQVNLDGYFLFDGLNNSGTSLFLTESLGDDPTAKYQVRRYDLASGVLDPHVIVDKLEGSTIMSGVRQTAVASKNGDWLYSLYLNPSYGPFIHALPINDEDNGGLAFCIDLPKNGKEDMAKQARWSQIMSADKRTLYAVNGALGLVVEYGVGEGVPQMVRIGTLFGPAASAGGRPAAQPVGAISALAPDGKTLFAPGEQGLLVIDMKDLKLRGRYLPDWTIDGVALSPDGARLYAASAARGKIVRLTPSAGTIAAEVPAAGRPSGVVRVEARKTS